MSELQDINLKVTDYLFCIPWREQDPIVSGFILYPNH